MEGRERHRNLTAIAGSQGNMEKTMQKEPDENKTYRTVLMVFRKLIWM